MLDIVTASKNDIPLIHALAHQIWPHTFKGILSPAQIEYMLDWMYSESSLAIHFDLRHMHYFLAVWQQQPVGFLCLQHHLANGAKSKIHRIYVLPDMQGNGVGRALMQHAEVVTRNAGDAFLFLNVNRFNKALDFYTYLGYKVIGEEDIDIGQGYLMEDYILEKQL